MGVIWCKFGQIENLSFLVMIDKIFEMCTKRSKILKVYIKIFKKMGHWVWNVHSEKGVIGCKICGKKGGLLTGR